MMKNKKKKKKKGPAAHGAELLTGTLEVTRSGMGFVIVEGREQDILVRPADFHTALHGDTVRVRAPRFGIPFDLALSQEAQHLVAPLLLYLVGYGPMLCAITVASYIKEWRHADASWIKTEKVGRVLG